MDNEQLDTQQETNDTVDEQQSFDTNAETIDVNYASMSDEEFMNFINAEDVKEEPQTQQETDENNTDTNAEEEQKEEKGEEQLPSFDNEKELYDKVFTEGFKARGKMVKPKNLQDLVSLAQKGVDYNAKNREFNQYRKQIETLNSAGITNLEDLTLAIDLFKGNPEAIKKVISDKQIDVYNLGDEVTYKPHSSYTPTDSSISFRDIIDSVKDRDYFKDLQDVALSKWDSASRQQLLTDNSLFKGLIDEFEMGRFNQIQEQVEHERMFGRLEGLNDLEAYVKVVTDYENQQKSKTQTHVSKDIDVNKQAVAQVKRADNSKSIKKTYSDAELAKLSDEEYMKLYNAGMLD